MAWARRILLSVTLAIFIIQTVEPQQPQQSAQEFFASLDQDYYFNRVLPEFEAFKAKYGRNYPSAAEEEYRLVVFACNLIKIDRHNSILDRTFDMGVTYYADFTQGEFIQVLGTDVSDDSDFGIEVPSGAESLSDDTFRADPGFTDYRAPSADAGHGGSFDHSVGVSHDTGSVGGSASGSVNGFGGKTSASFSSQANGLDASFGGHSSVASHNGGSNGGGFRFGRQSSGPVQPGGPVQPSSSNEPKEPKSSKPSGPVDPDTIDYEQDPCIGPVESQCKFI